MSRIRAPGRSRSRVPWPRPDSADGRAHGITGSLGTHRGDAASPDAVSRGGTDHGGPRAYPRRRPDARLPAGYRFGGPRGKGR